MDIQVIYWCRFMGVKEVLCHMRENFKQMKRSQISAFQKLKEVLFLCFVLYLMYHTTLVWALRKGLWSMWRYGGWQVTYVTPEHSVSLQPNVHSQTAPHDSRMTTNFVYFILEPANLITRLSHFCCLWSSEVERIFVYTETFIKGDTQQETIFS